MRNKVAALYCRVDSGTNPLSQQIAVNIQKQQLERYAREHDFTIAAYYEDIGYSGCDLSRPGLNALTADFKNGLFETVLVANKSRLYRSSVVNVPTWGFRIISLDSLQQRTER